MAKLVQRLAARFHFNVLLCCNRLCSFCPQVSTQVGLSAAKPNLIGFGIDAMGFATLNPSYALGSEDDLVERWDSLFAIAEYANKIFWEQMSERSYHNTYVR
jgi:hypothetical protein